MRRMAMTCGVLVAFSSAAAAQDVGALLATIKAVGKEGAGNVEAAKAWKTLVARGPSVLPDVLAGMDEASPAANNWLRTAVEAIQDRVAPGQQKDLAGKLEAFLKDTRHAGHSRRLAYECLVRMDATTPDRLLPKLLDDPSAELRRDSVAARLKFAAAADFKSPEAQRDFFKDLLKFARDRDQVEAICKELKTHKIEVDLTTHYGFVTRWLLAGPFDNAGGVGFNAVYPPEKGVDPRARYADKNGKLAGWQEYTTKKDLGLVDLNEVVGKLHGAVYYGFAAVQSEKEQPVEIRAGSNNAIRMWLNGKEIYFREEYHHGMAMDQHVGKGVLKAGRNEILIKVCQNEQTEVWAQQWSFQLRICDALGAAVPVVNVTGAR